jgi:hypothetical protein
MLRYVLTASIAIILFTSPGDAATKSEKDKCFQKVLEIGEIQESEDTPGIGEMAQQEVDELVEIATHLCQQGNFRYAEKLLEIARGMLASE